MTKILQILGVLGGLIPIILTLIKEFEVPGFGKEKKMVILGTIAELHKQLNITAITKEKLLGIAGSFIDIAVAFYNAVGWFQHGNPTDSS